jgi:hypothetical protein
MVQEAPIRADMRDPRNERFFSRVWERFFAELPGEIESVTEQNIESGIAMANYFAEQLEKLIESIPPPQDYLHRIEELEILLASMPFVLPKVKENPRIVRITSADTPYAVLFTDVIIFCDTDGGAIEIDLQAGVNGRGLQIQNVGSSGNDVTVDPNGTEQIFNGGAGVSFTMYDSEGITIHYNSTEGWW